MEEASASRTAMRVAMRRAAHQAVDAEPRVLDDPIAIPIIGAEAARKLQQSSSREQGRLARSARAFLVARSRFAEDALGRFFGGGVRQYVILGAGLDTFAYRHRYPETLRVFEVDHPATQAWKRRKLAAARIAIPVSVSYVPVDFERDSLPEQLKAAGFDPRAAAFVSWLGVTMYLTASAFTSTLAWIGSSAAGGGIAFDYGVARSELGWGERLALTWLSRRVARAGEPFRSLFEPAALRRQLTGLGFSNIEDLGPDEINARYFTDRGDGLRVRGGLGRLISASVAGGGAPGRPPRPPDWSAR